MKFFSAKNIFYYVLLLLCFLLVYPYIFDAKLSLGGDNANYYSLAKGLATNNAYANNYLISPAPANHFPPGYPFIMSLLMRLGIDSIFAMKVLNGILLFISSILLFQITLKLTKNNTLSFVLALLTLLNANLLEYSSIMMSEISFLFFLLLTIYFFMLSKDREHSLKTVYFYLFILSLIALLYVRTIGIGLFGAALIMFLFNKKFKAAGILFFSVFILLLPWQIRSAKLGGNSYMKQVMRINPYDASKGDMKLGDWGNRAMKNSVRYLSKEIPAAIFPALTTPYKNPQTGKIVPASMLNWIVGGFLIVLAILGIWSVSKYRWFFLMFFGATLAVLLLWPEVWFGIRFLLPTVPLSLIFIILGFCFLIQLIIKSKFNLLESKKFSFVFLLLVFVQINPIKKLNEKANMEHPKLWQNYIKMAEWCGENLEEGSVVATRKPAIFYVASQVKTTVFPYTQDREEFIEKFQESGATHALVEQLGYFQTGKYLVPAVKAEPEKFPVVHTLSAKVVKDAKGQQITRREAMWLVGFKPDLGYNGAYVDGKRHGAGRYATKNGTLIEAHWVNDTLNGIGIMTTPDSVTYEGEWVKGKKHGIFYIQRKNQRIESIWNNGVMEVNGYELDSAGKRTKQIRLR